MLTFGAPPDQDSALFSLAHHISTPLASVFCSETPPPAHSCLEAFTLAAVSVQKAVCRALALAGWLPSPRAGLGSHGLSLDFPSCSLEEPPSPS